MTTYKTKQGDMWDDIAFKQLGSSLYTSDLLELNPDYREIIIFSAGIEILLPEADPLKEFNTTKPPWED